MLLMLHSFNVKDKKELDAIKEKYPDIALLDETFKALSEEDDRMSRADMPAKARNWFVKINHWQRPSKTPKRALLIRSCWMRHSRR